MGAPTFKEQIAADISTTFLNCLEFADTHTVNGKEMAAVVDDNELLERDKAKIMAAQTEGTYKARGLSMFCVLLYRFPRLPISLYLSMVERLSFIR